MLPSAPLQRRVAGLALAFFLIVAVAILAGVADDALVCDDAFYYFQIAHNAALGRGFTFDGLAPTNGFHPLWAWICAALWRIGGGSAWPPVHAALILLVAATAATGLVIARIGREVAGERAGATMAALWLLSPYALLIPLRGCEGALSALALALATWSAVALDRAAVARAGEGALVRRAALVGLAVGVAGLARTENVLYGAAALVFVAWRTRSWRAVAAYVVVAGAVVSPWLAWSWLRLGTVVQVSGSAKHTLDLYGRLPPVRDPLRAVANVIHALVGTAGWTVGEEFRKKPVGAVLVALTAAVVAVAAWRGRARPSPRALLPLYAHALGQLAFYCWFLRAYYNWYFLPVALAIAVFVGERLGDARRHTALVAATALTGAIAVLLFFEHSPPRRHGAAALPIVAAAASLPLGARIGIVNAGAAGYFLGYERPDVTVVNLDCVVNNVAFAALRHGAYDRYLLDHVDFVAEPPDARFLGDGAARFARDHLADAAPLPLYRVQSNDAGGDRLGTARQPGAGGLRR
jgi:hypothetical protein